MIQTSTSRGPFAGLENCALCGAITSKWTAMPDRADGEQVACCDACATAATPLDVPTKAAWFKASERARRKAAEGGEKR